MGHLALCPFMMKHFISLHKLIVYKKTLILQITIILHLHLSILFLNVLLMLSKLEIRRHLCISFQYKQLLKNIQKLWVLSLVDQQRPLQLLRYLYSTTGWDLNRLENIKRSRDIQNEKIQHFSFLAIVRFFFEST